MSNGFDSKFKPQCQQHWGPWGLSSFCKIFSRCAWVNRGRPITLTLTVMFLPARVQYLLHDIRGVLHHRLSLCCGTLSIWIWQTLWQSLQPLQWILCALVATVRDDPKGNGPDSGDHQHNNQPGFHCVLIYVLFFYVWLIQAFPFFSHSQKIL